MAFDFATRASQLGVRVNNVKADLPRNGSRQQRPIGLIKRIVVHYDGVDAPAQYNHLDRMKSEAWYHIRRDWGKDKYGNIYRGDGIQYAINIARDGSIYWMRDFEEHLWHCGDPNFTSLAVKVDGGPNQEPNFEQSVALERVLEILAFHCPEFPAGQGDVYGHLEMKQFGGTATACPGRFLTLVTSYRTGRSVDASRYAATPIPVRIESSGTSPVPAPAPVPAQQPQADIAASAAVNPNPGFWTKKVKVTADGLRYRRSADLQSDAIGWIAKGVEFEVYDKPVKADGYTWYQRVSDNYWVASVGFKFV